MNIRLCLSFLLLVALGLLSGVAQAKSVILVHGAWQGPWVWDQVIPRLREEGHSVKAVQLPAHYRDQTPIRNVTLSLYISTVSKAIDALLAANRQHRKVTIAGHSFGGSVITGVGEARAEVIEHLIYIGAYLPNNGSSTNAMNEFNTASHLVPPIFTVNFTTGIADVAKSALGDVFCADCPPRTLQRLIDTYRGEPAAPFLTPIFHTAKRFGKIRKSFIRTLQDRAVSLPLQNYEIARNTFRTVKSLNTSHCPFLSKPALFSRTLLNLLDD